MKNALTNEHILVIQSLIDKYVKVTGKQRFRYILSIYKKHSIQCGMMGYFMKCMNFEISGFILRIIRDRPSYEKSSWFWCVHSLLQI